MLAKALAPSFFGVGLGLLVRTSKKSADKLEPLSDIFVVVASFFGVGRGGGGYGHYQ